MITARPRQRVIVASAATNTTFTATFLAPPINATTTLLVARIVSTGGSGVTAVNPSFTLRSSNTVLESNVYIYDKVMAAGVTGCTVTLSTAGGCVIVLDEYNNMVATTPNDAAVANASAGANSPIVTATSASATTQPYDLLLAVASNAGGAFPTAAYQFTEMGNEGTLELQQSTAVAASGRSILNAAIGYGVKQAAGTSSVTATMAGSGAASGLTLVTASYKVGASTNVVRGNRDSARRVAPINRAGLW